MDITKQHEVQQEAKRNRSPGFLTIPEKKLAFKI
jgi:hypothetical protein